MNAFYQRMKSRTLKAKQSYAGFRFITLYVNMIISTSLRDAKNNFPSVGKWCGHKNLK